jgi:hypothetical protein
MENQLETELLISSRKIWLSELPDLEIGVKITNRSHEYLPVDLSQLALFVDFTRSIAWDLAMQNGTLINLRMAPGQSETIQWKMGEALFESAGKFRLVLSGEGKIRSKQTIEIISDSER